MADDFEEFVRGVQAPTTGPVAVPSGAGQDEFARFVSGSTQVRPEPDIVPSGEATAVGVKPPDQFESFVSGEGPARGLGETFTRGVARNYGQWAAAAPTLTAVYQELQGDTEAAIESMKRAQEIQAPYGDSDWDLSKIHSPGDFAYWLTEKLGEQGITMLATLGTGGTAGIAASTLGKYLLGRGVVSASGKRALELAGVTVPTYMLTSGIETAGTAEEQFQATKGRSTNPERSIAAGMAKGVLELYTPMRITNAMMKEGLQLGKTTLGAVGKTAITEGLTEFAQENIDIFARKLEDPNYNYFGSGAEWYKGEGFQRAIEAGVTGAAVGGIYGAPFARMELNQEKRRELGDQTPGDIRTVPKLTPEEQQEYRLRKFEDDRKAEDELFSRMQADIRKSPIYEQDGDDFDRYLLGSEMKDKVLAEYGQNGEDLRKALETVKTQVIDPRGNDYELLDRLPKDIRQAYVQGNADDKISVRSVVRWYNSGGPEAALEHIKGADADFNERAEQNVKDELAKGGSAIERAFATSKKRGLMPMDQMRLHPSVQNQPIQNKAEQIRPTMGGFWPTAGGYDRADNYPMAPSLFGQEEMEIPEGRHREAYLQAQRDATTQLQNEANAGTPLDNLSRERFGVGFAELPQGERDRLREAFETERRLSEAADTLAKERRGEFRVIPGGKQELPSQNIIADDKVSINKIYVTEHSETWQVTSNAGATAHVRVNKVNGEVHISRTDLKDPAEKGKGHGLAMYKEIVDQALKAGYTVRSDDSVSVEAARMYEALKRRGYAVIGPRGKLVQHDQYGFWERGMTLASMQDPGVYRVLAAPKPKEVEQLSPSKKGPITRLREMLWPKNQVGSGNVKPQEIRAKSIYGDVLGISPLTGTLSQKTMEDWLDVVDALTKRYVEINPDGTPSQEVFTNTEYQDFESFMRPQHVKPMIVEVQPDMLIPAGITAKLKDINFNDPFIEQSIWFLPQVEATQRRQLLREFVSLQLTKDEAEAGFKYNELLTKGLRVIPQRGAGFWYNGPIEMKGRPFVQPRDANRSTEIGFLNPLTMELTPIAAPNRFTPDELTQFMNGGYLPVALDWNKIREGDLVEISPGKFKLRNMDLTKLTTGIVPAYDASSEWIHGSRETPRATGKTFEVSIDRTTSTPAEEKELIKWRDTVRQVAPAIEKILKDIGFGDAMPRVVVSNFYGPNPTEAWYDSQDNVVVLAPRHRDNLMNTGDLEADILSMLMHELGHYVTFSYFSKLSVPMQESLMYAWNKARTAGSRGDFSRALPTMNVGEAVSTQGIPLSTARYYTGLSEFLAEQFRRWATSQEPAIGYVKRTFKQGADALERYYARWETAFGKTAALNMQNPDYAFSAAMEYLRSYASRVSVLKQLERQQALYNINQDIWNSPAAFDVAETVANTILEVAKMWPPEVRAQINLIMDPGVMGPRYDVPVTAGSTARFITADSQRLNLIEFAVSAMMNSGIPTKQTVVHELMHAYDELGIISKPEAELLIRDLRGHEDKYMSPELQAQTKAMFRDFARNKLHMDTVETEVYVKDHFERELRAYYIEKFAETGEARSPEARTIMSRLLELLERVMNAIQGLGFQTKDDVIRAFFSGEMLARRERGKIRSQKVINQAAKIANIIDQTVAAGMIYNNTWNVGPYNVSVIYSGMVKGDKLSSDYVTYHVRDPRTQRVVGSIELVNKMPQGFEIAAIESEGALIGDLMWKQVEKDLGIPMKLAGELTAQGFAAASLMMKVKKTPDVMKLYQKIVTNNYETMESKTYYASPRIVRDRVEGWTQIVNAMEAGLPTPYMGTLKRAKEWLKFWTGKYNNLPKGVWNDPRMDQMFQLPRNYERDEVQGSILKHGAEVAEGQLLQSLGFPTEAPTTDAFQWNVEKKLLHSQAEQARKTGTPMELSAPESLMSMNSRRAWEWATGYGSTRAVEQEVVNLEHEKDRIGLFTKVWWSLKQMAWRNEHIAGLRLYVQFVELMKQLAGKWLARAGETARTWEQVEAGPRREAVADALFALTEMEYLSRAERAAKVVREPTGWMLFVNPGGAAMNPPSGETLTLFNRHRVDPKDYALIRQVALDFWDFLNEVEETMDRNLQRTYAGKPTQYAAAKAALQAEFNEYRKKPYFPMVRFGEFTITVRDENTNKVVWANAYQTQRQRDAAVEDVRAQYPTDDITVSRVDPRFHEFMGLPSPLLKAIRTELPGVLGMSATDKIKLDTWLETYEMLHSPDRSFRKRWMPRTGLPGYNTDAFRAYAHYFTFGSRYLSRLAYMNPMQSAVNSVQRSAMDGTLGNSAKRNAIATYMNNHFRYMMEGGRDSGKFRALASIYFLGFSPAAAFVNVTQVLTTVFPTLSTHFGRAAAYSTLNGTITALKATNGFATGNASFETARQEAIRQGYINVGQAAELAGFAEGSNLAALLTGTKAQKSWRQISYWAMKMFSATEHYNREFTFKAAWDLAIKYPNVPRLQTIDVRYTFEINQLRARTGLSAQEAVAYMFAREMIERTQFEYSRDTDPPFMRGKYIKDVLIFFKFTHSMLYALRFNGAMFHMLLVMAFLFGVSGLPFADELGELAKILAQLANKLFGTSINLEGAARKWVRDITRGTIFDEVGPDLFLHGVSRYGFGLGLLPDGYGAPSFDASANGSMGRIVPGLAEFMHGYNTDSAFKDNLADGAQKMAGAAYGQILTAMSVAMDPFSVDGHKWEQLMPRFMRGLAKAYRYAPPELGLPEVGPLKSVGAETTRGGAKIAKFDITDPGDLTTVLFQAAGFTPTKVSMTWDLLRESKEVIQVYNARRTAIYAQYDKALMLHDQAAIADVNKAIRDYNDQVIRFDPNMAIKQQALAQSIRQRQQARAMQEMTLAKDKKEYLVTKRLEDSYPGLKPFQQKVK